MQKNLLLLILITLISVVGCGKKYSLDRKHVNMSEEWAFYRGDITANGSSENSQYDGNLDILWEFKSNDKPVGPLTIYNGVLIYPGARNRIKFISTDLGKNQGYIKSRGVAQTGMVISDSLGYFAVSPQKSKLRCINLLNRKTLWKKDVKDAVGGSIIIQEKLILSSAEGRVFAFDKITGEILWEFKSKQRFTTPPLFDGNAIWQVSEEGTLFAINLNDGKEIFHVSINHPVGTSIAFDQSVYVTDITGTIYKIDRNDGHIIWQTETGGASWGPATVSGSSLITGHSGGEIFSLSVEDGSIQWRYDVVDVVSAGVLKVGGYVAFGTKRGEFYLLDSSDGSVIEKRELKGLISFPPVTDGKRIFVATDKGMITCFGVRNERDTKSND